MQTLIIITLLFAFFITSFLFTQKLYSRPSLIFSFLVFFSIVTSIVVFMKCESYIIGLSLMHISYFLFLYLIRINYKRINYWLIKRKLIQSKFLGKEFTFVNWSDLPGVGSWWDKDLAVPPSLLDEILTLILLIIPLMVLIIFFSRTI